MKNVAKKSFKIIKLTSCIIDLKWRHLLTRVSHHTSVKFYIVSKNAHVFVSKQCMQIKQLSTPALQKKTFNLSSKALLFEK